MNSIEAVCAVWLRDIQLERGTHDELLHTPADEFVPRFIQAQRLLNSEDGSR